MPFFLVNEDSTAIYTAILSDETGPIPGKDITSINVTLYDEVSDDIINARDKSTDNITVNSDGLLTWLLNAADNPILDDKFHEEKHRALFRFSWQGGTKKNEHEVSIFVKNYRRISGTAFLPSDLLSLLAWYDADSITGLSDGDRIGTWFDRTANSFDATQAISDSLKPLFKTNILNGKPIVRADGIDDFLTIGNKSGFENDDYAIFFVFQRTGSLGTIKHLLGMQANSDSDSPTLLSGVTVHSDTDAVLENTAISTLVNVTTFNSNFAFTLDTFFIAGINKSGTNAFFRKNGIQTNSTIVMADPIRFTDVNRRTLLMAENDNTKTNGAINFFQGDFAEILFFNNSLTTNETNQVEKYLSDKWAIPLE